MELFTTVYYLRRWIERTRTTNNKLTRPRENKKPEDNRHNQFEQCDKIDVNNNVKNSLIVTKDVTSLCMLLQV